MATRAKTTPSKAVKTSQAKDLDAGVIQDELLTASLPPFHQAEAERLVAAAKQGNTDAARAILAQYIAIVSERSPKSWRGPYAFTYACYIADAFAEILDKNTPMEPALALGIKTSKAGRRKGAVTHDSEAIAAAFEWAIGVGYSEKVAIKKISDATGANPKTVRNAVKAFPAFEYFFDTDDLLVPMERIEKLIWEILIPPS